MKQKSDIPNVPGFRFSLFRADGSSVPCVVGTRPNGSFCAVSLHTRKPVSDSEDWSNFTGWEELPKSSFELHIESLPDFPGMRCSSVMGKTADQIKSHLAGQALPRGKEAVIVANLNSLERITFSPAKSPEGKRLYALEIWQK